MSGIISYGAYIPVYRIRTADIATVWGEDVDRIEKGLGIMEKAVGGVLFSAALTSIVTGITEPIEFAFMFVAPVLYVVHAVLTGIWPL
jgi:hypothetical protein